MSFKRNASYNSFRHQLPGIGIGLEVAVFRALTHRFNGTHAPVFFVFSSLIYNRFTGRFFNSCKERTNHYAMSSGSNSFSYVARKTDSPVSNYHDTAAFNSLRYSIHTRKLRNTNTSST